MLIERVGIKNTDLNILSDGDVFDISYELVKEFKKVPMGSKVSFKTQDHYNEILDFKVIENE